MRYFLMTSLLLFNMISFSQDSLSRKDLPAAERVLGLQLKDAERDSVFDDVKNMVKELDKMRQYTLSNGTPLGR